MKKVLVEWGFSAIGFFTVYFSAVQPVLLAITFFVLCDLILGVTASKKRGEPMSSKRLRDTLMKLISYGIGILIAHVMEKQFLPSLACLKLVGTFLAYIELKSMNENIEIITGTNIFKSILKKIKV